VKTKRTHHAATNASLDPLLTLLRALHMLTSAHAPTASLAVHRSAETTGVSGRMHLSTPIPPAYAYPSPVPLRSHMHASILHAYAPSPRPLSSLQLTRTTPSMPSARRQPAG
jgi:hypothetical protein